MKEARESEQGEHIARLEGWAEKEVIDHYMICGKTDIERGPREEGRGSWTQEVDPGREHDDNAG